MSGKERTTGRNARGWQGLLGLGIAIIGLAALGAVGGYEAYASRARGQLDRLVVAGPVTPQAVLPREWAMAQGGPGPPMEGAAQPMLQPPPEAPRVAAPGELERRPPVPDDASGLTDPPAAAAGETTPAPATTRFRWVDWGALPATQGVAPRATWISVPAIDVESPVVELAVVWDGKARVWQRPKNAVGHHEGTANPGEVSNVVLSGHVNSPVRGEGRVFRRLPELAELLELGQQVEVLVSTEDRTYVYQVVRSAIVAPDSREVFDPTREPALTLITCVPDMVFSHRLVVTAWLVRVGEGGRPALGQTVNGVVVEAGR